MNVESSEDDEDEEVVKKGNGSQKGAGAAGRKSDNDDDDDDDDEEGEGQQEEEEEEEEEDEDEEQESDGGGKSVSRKGATNQEADPTRRKKRKKSEASQAERGVMVSARCEVIGKTFAVKKQKEGTSAIWHWFTRVFDETGKLCAVSCLCGGKWAFKDGWGNGHLRRHAKKCEHVLRVQRQAQMTLEIDEDDVFSPGIITAKVADSDGVGDGLTQSRLRFDKHEKKLLALPTIPYSQENARQALVEMVAMDDQSFMTSDHNGFVMFCSVMRPEFEVVGRRTVQRDAIESFLKSKAFIMFTLKEMGSGMKNLTTDLWSSLVAAGFMCITVHFINAKWELIHFLLSFTEPPQPHDAVGISTELLAVVKAYDLDVLSVTCDNASVNDAAMRMFIQYFGQAEIPLVLSGELTHNRCVGHIFHLMAACCLDITRTFCEGIRKNVQILKRQNKQRQQLQSILENLDNYDADFKGRAWPPMDVKTRWNSTSEMMTIADAYAEPWAQWFLRGGSCQQIPQEQWKNGSLINAILTPLKDATLIVSAFKTPTIHLVFPLLVDIKNHVDQAHSALTECGDLEAASAVNDMRDKFDKYFASMPLIYIVACILDPSMKMKFLEHVCDLSGDEEGREANRGHFLRVCNEFDKFYRLKDRQQRGGSTEPIAGAGGGQVLTRAALAMGAGGGGSGSIRESFLASNKKSAAALSGSGRPMTIADEVRRYLSEPICELESGPGSDGILKWWKFKCVEFPILSRIAKDILSVPATSVPSENIFSRSGRVVSPSRCSLAPETIEALMVWGDWLKKRFVFGWKKLY